MRNRRRHQMRGPLPVARSIYRAVALVGGNRQLPAQHSLVRRLRLLEEWFRIVLNAVER